MIDSSSAVLKSLGRRWRGASRKMLVVIGGLLLLTGAVSGTVLYQTKAVGDDLVEIAEHNLPLVRSVTLLTVHQLEQAVALEQSLRYGEEMQSDNAKRAFFDRTIERFEKNATLTDSEFREARELSLGLLEETLTRRKREEYTRVLGLLEEFDAAHATYEAHAREVHAAMRQGDIDGASKAADTLYAEERKLDASLEYLLAEIQEFTQETATRARQQEIEALWTVAILTVLTVFFGLAGAVLIATAAAKKPDEIS